VAREGADLGLHPAAGLVQLPNHRERPAMVALHVAQEQQVEAPTVRVREALECRRADHAGHEGSAAAVVVLVLLGGRNRLTTVFEPLLHLAHLRLLGELHAAREQRHVAGGAARADHARHHEGLRVVVDHPAHEAHVGVRVLRLLELLRLGRRELTRRLPGRPGLHDRDIGLLVGPLGVVRPAAAAAGRHKCERQRASNR
jgi:hypothetical protein